MKNMLRLLSCLSILLLTACGGSAKSPEELAGAAAEKATEAAAKAGELATKAGEGAAKAAAKAGEAAVKAGEAASAAAAKAGEAAAKAATAAGQAAAEGTEAAAKAAQAAAKKAGEMADKAAAKAGEAAVRVPSDVAAPPADADKTSSGLASKVLSAGHGTKPTAEDTVKVHYSGWTTDGKMFDSSVTRGTPATFPLRGVIPGWTEGLQLMQVGEKRRLWIPEQLAYKGRPGRPQGMLVFDVELLEIIAPPSTPEDVAAPPEDAAKTASGLASKVLGKGSGTKHPTATSTVTVHYSGWTTDGKMFDSSVGRGRPATFPLNRVIAGWTEGLQLMVEGEKRRLWIPEALAYQGKPGRPQGMLVFDVELISIND